MHGTRSFSDGHLTNGLRFGENVVEPNQTTSTTWKKHTQKNKQIDIEKDTSKQTTYITECSSESNRLHPIPTHYINRQSFNLCART